MKQIMQEGLAKIEIEPKKIVSKEMDVFYNPVMSINRDISVLVLNSIPKNKLQVADPMAASGVRSIRFLKELNKNKIDSISINDDNLNSINSIKNNLKLNKININNKKILISKNDANIFLLNSTGFDYIDIDPFGTPNPFLDAACKRISRQGILAVTATDTSALCGTYADACRRKYWANPKQCAIMHEIGLRILIRKIQLVGAQYGKALTPLFSYSKDHYMRVFLENEKGKSRADEILKLHGEFENAGPMWLGNLFDEKLCNKIFINALKNNIFNKNKELTKFLKIIKDESKINSVGFYELHYICEKNKIKAVPKKEIVMKKIKNLGYKASETHFNGYSVISNIPLNKLIRILKLFK